MEAALEIAGEAAPAFLRVGLGEQFRELSQKEHYFEFYLAWRPVHPIFFSPALRSCVSVCGVYACVYMRRCLRDSMKYVFIARSGIFGMTKVIWELLPWDFLPYCFERVRIAYVVLLQVRESL